MIIYDGPSALDGAPIIVIATFDTSNIKTGDMVQIWILCRDTAPHHAVALGADVSICGHCVHRRGIGGDCYVIPFQAPLAVWNAFHNGSYENYEPGDLAGRRVRFGAYGDPAAVFFDVWRPVLDDCDIDGSTGYSHQMAHKNWDPRIAMFCQISADTPKMAQKAWSQGYKTFRIAGDAQKRMPGEIECLSDSAGLSCYDCRLCDGQSANIVINAHGSRSAGVKQHDYIARTG